MKKRKKKCFSFLQPLLLQTYKDVWSAEFSAQKEDNGNTAAATAAENSRFGDIQKWNAQWSYLMTVVQNGFNCNSMVIWRSAKKNSFIYLFIFLFFENLLYFLVFFFLNMKDTEKFRNRYNVDRTAIIFEKNNPTKKEGKDYLMWPH